MLMINLNIRVSDRLGERLRVLATKTGRTKSYYVRAALEEKLEELEDYFSAMKSLKDIETGKSRIWTHEDIEEGRDLED
jgi:RHH-type transcriptional regulator, rel operon repressor / antitoxin RelB